MKKFFMILSMLVFTRYFYNTEIVLAQDSSGYKQAVRSFSKENFQRHLNFLGSDLFEGRGTGTIGGNLAAKYLALEFEKLHLKPIGSNNTFYQYIPMHGSYPLPSSKLILFLKNDSKKLSLSSDYLMYVSGEQTYIPVPLPLVFVGYGIVAPEYDYNDYQSVDVEGKIVVFLEGEPFSNDPDYFDGSKSTIYSMPEAKQRIALSRGARGTILIPNVQSDNNFDWSEKIQSFSFENVTLAYSVSSNLSIMINPEIANALFEDSGYTLQDIYRMHQEDKMRSFELSTKISFEGEYKERDFVASNVVGMLEGSDNTLKDSYILVTAHYDHLGVGPAVKSDSIYNGVYDNAVGVSAVLEIARVFGLYPDLSKRSIIFLLVTGEEKGLLGSTYYCDNPVRPLYKTIADVNIDGLSLFDEMKSVVGVGSEYSTLKDYLERVVKGFDIKVVQIPPQFTQTEAYSKSDQFAFARAGIPSILLMEGTDYVHISKEEGIGKMIEYITKYYHTPFDDLSLPINYDAALQHIQLIFSLVYELSNSLTEPEWNSNSPFINARLRSDAEKK